ncbi:hypothetical protein L6R52_11000 [Myxococcota bacterium]|nr:hypothetical protein [Myxococcota bacterium]
MDGPLARPSVCWYLSTMFVTEHISTILLVTGLVTAAPILQFFAPTLALKLLYQLEPHAEPAGAFFSRHWGMIVGCFGALLVYSASHPEVRAPLMVAAVVEKIALVGMIVAGWRAPHTKGMRLVVAFDSTCVVLYSLYLLGVA